jgi:hypothetical protein
MATIMVRVVTMEAMVMEKTVALEMMMISRSISQSARRMFCIVGSSGIRKRTWFPTKMARRRFECKVQGGVDNSF